MLTIPAGFEWVLVCACLIALQCTLTGFGVGAARSKYFNKKFFESNFPELKPHPENGYPDTGSGLFAHKLPLPAWIDFNNSMRVHMNFIEGVATILVLTIVSGLSSPRFTIMAAVLYMVGRLIYGFGYKAKGSRGRIVGALIFDVALIALLGNALYGMYSIGGGVDGLMKVLFPK